MRTALLLLTAGIATLTTSAPPSPPKFPDIAPTPPKGWSSWYAFAENITHTALIDTAKVLKSNGALDAGYDYFLLDDGWMAPARAEGAARRSPRGDGAPRRRRLTSSGPPGRVRNGASASGGGARSRSQPDLDADARLARQLQQEEEQQAQQLYR